MIPVARQVLLKSSTEEKKTLKAVTRTVPNFRGWFVARHDIPANADEVVEILDLSAPEQSLVESLGKEQFPGIPESKVTARVI